MHSRCLPSRGTGFLRAAGRPVVLLMVTAIAWTVSAQDAAKPGPKPDAVLSAQYEERFAELDARDVKGHYALAQWCDGQGQYELVVKQTEYVLKLDPKHAGARQLNAAALRKLDELRPGKGGRKRPPTAAEAGLISKEDVQKLRFLEMLDYQAERLVPEWRESLSVRFEKGTLVEFLDTMGDSLEFAGKPNRQRFLSLTPTQQVQVMRQFSGLTFQPKIAILSDPLVFRRFRPVAAIIERGCSTRDCHGGENPAKPFGWRGHFLYPEQSLYTQFLILDRVVLGRERLIDRGQPADSLILQYGLPARVPHKPHPGQMQFKPLYPRGLDDPGYRMVSNWIEMLRVPRPVNGIKLEGYPEPPPPGSHLTNPKESATQPAK
jgi:hypothetical protein